MTQRRLFLIAIFFLLLSLLFATQCLAAERRWTGREKGLFGLFIVEEFYDAKLTKGRKREYNPVLRDRHGRPDMEKIITAKILTGLVVYTIADRWPEHRGKTLWLVVGLQGAIVGFNY